MLAQIHILPAEHAPTPAQVNSSLHQTKVEWQVAHWDDLCSAREVYKKRKIWSVTETVG